MNRSGHQSRCRSECRYLASQAMTDLFLNRSLDQMEEYVGAFHEHVRATSGMVGFSMFGGPTPNAGGALSIYVWVSA
jgi:hypothetical protein